MVRGYLVGGCAVHIGRTRYQPKVHKPKLSKIVGAPYGVLLATSVSGVPFGASAMASGNTGASLQKIEAATKIVSIGLKLCLFRRDEYPHIRAFCGAMFARASFNLS